MTDQRMITKSRSNVLLNQYFDPTQSLTFPIINKPITIIKERLYTNKSRSGIKNSYSEAQFYSSLSLRRLENKGTSIEKYSEKQTKEEEEEEEEGIGNKCILKGNIRRHMNYYYIKKESVPIIQEKSKAYLSLYPRLKSPYKLIDELKTAVEQVVKCRKNGSLINQIHSEYLIDQNKKQIIDIKKKLQNNRYYSITKEEIEEMYDKFTPPDFTNTKLLRKIKCFLNAKDSKLNQENIPKEMFFEKFENKINFKYDIFLVPTILNRLSNYTMTNENRNTFCKKINCIHQSILRFLYSKRITEQKKKDILLKNTKTFNRIEQQYAIYNAQKGKKTSVDLVKIIKPEVDNINNNTAVNKGRVRATRTLSEHQYFTESEHLDKDIDNIIKIETNLIKKEDENSPEYAIKMYDIEDYFIYKYNSYHKVKLSTDKERFILMNKYGTAKYRSLVVCEQSQIFT